MKKNYYNKREFLNNRENGDKLSAISAQVEIWGTPDYGRIYADAELEITDKNGRIFIDFDLDSSDDEYVYDLDKAVLIKNTMVEMVDAMIVARMDFLKLKKEKDEKE